MASKATKQFIRKSDIFLIVISLLFMLLAISDSLQAQRFAGTGANQTGVGTFAWSNPTNIYTNNAVYATTASMTASTGVSNYLRASNFGFSIPAGTTITGIIVNIDKKGSGANVKDNIVSLVNGSGTIVGDNKANTTAWGNGTDLLAIYGGTTDTWNASLTYSDINDVDFGVVISAKNTAAGARTASVDYITITVIYTGSFCTPTGNGSGTDGITNVTFNTINNTTTATNGYQNYSGSISTAVTKGSSYNLSVSVNTAGNYTNKQKAWIDWDQNGDFSVSEEYDLGLATNVASGISSLCPLSITVPAGAVVGTTQLRVSSKYSTYATACETSVDGEFEDYAIVVNASCTSPVISTVTPTNPSCNPDGSIAIVSTGTVTDYSIDNGSTWTASSSNTYTFSSLAAGTYNIKVRNTASCITTYVSNPVTLTAPSTSATPVVTSPICAGSTSVSGTSTEANGTTIEVFKGGVSQGTTTVSSNAWTKTGLTLANGNVITAKATASGKCVSALSSSVTVTSAPSITGQPGNQSVGAGSGTATFTVTATGGVTYQWQEYISSWNNVSNGGVYSGATSASLLITNPPLGMNGRKYRCIVSGCTPDATSDGNATLTVTLAYCASTTSTTFTSYFSAFSTSGGSTNINNNSGGCSANGYGDFTAQSVTKQQNGTVNYSMTVTDGVGINIWVDWNIDGDFADSGEKVYASASYKTAGTYTGSFNVPISATVGSTRMRIRLDWNSTDPAVCNTITRGETEDYTFIVQAASPMVYTSSTTTQTVTNPVSPFSVAQQIIGLQIVTTGAASPLSATSFIFNTNGTTDATADIICATLYWSPTSTFSTAFPLGTIVSQPNGSFTFTDSQTLSEGTNYFWLTYDVPLSATIGNMLDAECTQITVSGSNYTPSVTNPGSGRPIANTYLHNNNNSVSSCSGAYYDDGGLSGLYAQGTSYTKTFIPEAGKYMRITFSSFSTEATNDPLKIYDGPTTSSTLMGTWSGATGPGTKTGTSIGGELTVNFVSDNYTQTYAGWDASITCVSLPPNCATYSSPSNASVNQPTNTPIVWTNPATDGTHNPALSYKLYFGTDPAATNICNGTDIGNVLTWGMMLSTSTTYYWKIVPVNRSGDATGCNTIYSFTTAPTQTLTTLVVNGVNNPPTSYANIKAAYNACTTASPYIIVVKTGYTGTSAPSSEVFPIALNNTNSVPSYRSAANPIIIRPDAGYTYTFAAAANKVFEFSGGAKYVTIDGRQGGTGTANSFVFQNTSTTVPVISFTGDNSNNTLQYCKIQGRNQSSGLVDLRSPSGSGIRNITIDNNEICPNGAFFPTDGIYTEGTNALKNTNITITNNKVYDIWADVAVPMHGIFFGYNEFNYACTVSGNSIYFTTTKTPVTNSTSWYGIVVKGNDHTVSSNFIGGTLSGCGGTAMTIAGSKENHIYGISVTGTLATSSTTLSNNTVNKISLSSTHRSSDQLTNRIASSSNQTFAGIVIKNGAATVSNNNIGGPTAGDITVINTNTTDGTPILSTNYQGGSETNWGYSAELVGLVYNSKLGTINNAGNTIQGLKCYSSNNGANINCRIIGVLASTDDAVATGYTHTISNDVIGGVGGLIVGNATNTGDGYIWGIKTATGRGSIYITNNTISNLQVNSIGPYGFVRGIHNDAGTRCEIENNTVYNLSCASPNSLPALENVRRRVIVGVMCDNDGGFLDHFFVNQNTVYDLRSTTTSATKVNLIGVYYRHAAAPTYGRVFANKIYSINASSSNMASILVGIWGYGQNTITYNNMITLGNNVSSTAGASCPSGSPVNTGGYELRGIENYFGKNEFYFNSVNIIGTAGVGASNTYAYKYTNGVSETWCRVIKDNIFSNTRSSTSGTSKHYAFSVNGYEDCYTSDYNYFYVTGTNGVLFDYNGTDKTTIADWNAATGQDANSAGTSVTATPDPLFVDPNGCTCDLNITSMTSPVHGIGTTSGIPTYILVDIFGNPRSSSNDMGAVVVSGVLPIELLSFTAYKENNAKVKIQWVTSSEVNNDYFTVEKSMDGVSFEKLVELDGAGNSNEIISYETFDNNPVAGMNYYRLKQTDFDGKFTYSKTVALDFSKNDFSANIYPNPFFDVINIDINGGYTEDSVISVYDIAGKIVSQKSLNGSESHIVIQLDKNLPNGFYFVKLTTSSSTNYYKIVKRSE